MKKSLGEIVEDTCASIRAIRTKKWKLDVKNTTATEHCRHKGRRMACLCERCDNKQTCRSTSQRELQVAPAELAIIICDGVFSPNRISMPMCIYSSLSEENFVEEIQKNIITLPWLQGAVYPNLVLFPFHYIVLFLYYIFVLFNFHIPLLVPSEFVKVAFVQVHRRRWPFHLGKKQVASINDEPNVRHRQQSRLQAPKRQQFFRLNGRRWKRHRGFLHEQQHSPSDVSH